MRQFCDVIVSENIRIRLSTRIRNVIGFKYFHSGERIQKFPDLLANSPYACGRLPYPERKSCGFKNIWIRVDRAKVSHLGCVRLGNLDLDLKIWIFGFPIEHKIRKRISRRILLIEILTRHGFPISESATKSVVRFCVPLEIRRSRF